MPTPSILRFNILISFLTMVIFSNSLLADIPLTIEGLDNQQEENVRLHFSRWTKIPTDNERTLSKKINTTVEQGLNPLGYYHPKIDYKVEGDHLAVSITAGPAVHWDNISIVIPEIYLPENASNEKLYQENPFKTGEVINHPAYDSYKRDQLSIVQKLGYLDAHWSTSEFVINTKSNKADVTLIMSLGARYRVSAINLQGSSISHATLNELVDVQVGDWHDADKLGEIYNSLLSSGYFAYANLDVQTVPPDQAIYTIDLEEKSTDLFTTGLGYGTDTGVRGQLGWARPQINSRGDSLTTNIEVSQIGEEITAQYHIPWAHPQKRYLSVDTGWRREQTQDRESSLLKSGISLHRSKERFSQYSIGINLEEESYRQGNNSKEQITYVLPNTSISRYFFIGNESNPIGLVKWWASSALGISILENSSKFISLEGGANISIDITPKHGVSARFELGGIATDDFYSVPLSKRFYTGGDQSVRGFQYNTLSPVDEDNDLIGGQFLNVFGLEYRYAFKPNWKLATFVDSGRTFISSDEPFHTGAGVGLRWQLPVGALAFDIAKPISEGDNEKIRLHIYMSSLL